MSSEKHHRTSYRLQHHAYSEAGAYHIVICSHERSLIFGEIQNAVIELSQVGQIVDSEILKTMQMRSDVIVDTYSIMPNHVHLLILILSGNKQEVPRKFSPPKSGTVSSIINGLKGAVTSRVRKQIGPADVIVWQGRFFDRVVRDERELIGTRQYIIDNPAQWEYDRYNPYKRTNP